MLILIMKYVILSMLPILLVMQPAYAETYFYTTMDAPPGIDAAVINDAVMDALDTWSGLNPGLEFTKDTQDTFLISWIHDTGAPQDICWPGEKMCEIKIPVIKAGCNGELIYADENKIQNLLMRQIGHMLGVRHHPDPGHLMYSEEGKGVFDDNNYAIPDKLKGFYSGQVQDDNRIKTFDYYLSKLHQISDIITNMTTILQENYLDNRNPDALEKLSRIAPINIQVENKIMELDSSNKALKVDYVCRYE